MVTRLTLKQASVPLRRIDARNSLDALHQRGRGRERERRASYRTRTPSDIHAVSSRTRGCWKTGVGWLSAAPSAIEGFHNDTGGAKLRDRAAGENANEIKLPRSGRINLPIVSMKLTRERERERRQGVKLICQTAKQFASCPPRSLVQRVLIFTCVDIFF